ncbi:hypothetical protein NE857_17930 [Nocardiopsis exhalans]|uniref:Uncharacterized protein n=1 Tax=Nocardiopsis exhalans TaxID=163604 RepID=A0ABY5CZH7_9ACTN|nr:hypothetical protein [Nocardiopsis exhalans]USY17234.1 hypothetical protein NE857_17930 [Nocardiopsis exhalans]
MLGHLGERERGKLFAWLGRAPSETPDRREPPLTALGSRQYRAVHLPGSREGGYATCCQVLSGGRVVHEVLYEGGRKVFTHDDLVRALAGSPLVGERAVPGVSAIRHRG